MPKRAAIPWGAAGMVCLVVAVESLVGSKADRLVSHIPDAWAEARRMAESDEVRESRFLCLGDSQIKQGVLPNVIAARLGAPAYSLAVQGGQPPSAYFTLRRALDAGARPTGIIVGFLPSLLGVDTRINIRQWPELLDPAECLDLFATTSDLGMIAPTALREILPSLCSRDEIRRRAAALLSPAENAPEDVAAFRRNWRINRGSEVRPANPAYVDLYQPAHADRLDRAGLKIKRENQRYIHRLLTLARDRGITVYWLTPTLSPSWQAGYARNGVTAAYRRYLEALQSEFAGLIVLETSPAGDDPALFCDPFHLDERGASALTRNLADQIAAIEASRPAERPRWVALPPLRVEPVDASVENVVASKRAIHAPADRVTR